MKPFDDLQPGTALSVSSQTLQELVWCLLKWYAKKDGLPLDISGFKRYVGNITKDINHLMDSQIESAHLSIVMFKLLDDIVRDLKVNLDQHDKLIVDGKNYGPELKRQPQKK